MLHDKSPRYESLGCAPSSARLVRQTSEVAGLLALMLLTDARRAARTGPEDELIPLDKQDRTLWDRAESPKELSYSLPRCRKLPWGCTNFRRRSPPFTTKLRE